MHIGLSIPQYGRFADADFAARAATTAERIGYDSLWVGDRLLVATAPRSQYPGGGGNAPEEHQVFLDPLALLTVAATVTSRVRLGSSTLNALWQPPVLLARSLTTLDHVSGGRLDVGLGLGWSKDEYQAVGVPWAGRGARLEETLDVLEQVWAEDAVIEHHGTHWTIPKAIMNPKPVQRPRPPVLLGGFSQATLERVGRRADGWLAGGLPLPLLTQMWRAVLQRAEAAGRDPQALRLVVRVNPVLTAEPAPEAEVPRRGTVGQLVGYLSGVVEALDAEVLLDLHFAAGDPEEYLALAAGLHDALRERAS
ncbi:MULTISPECIES: TIGR03619 family F420-dependent LLM class oxidoreductase [Kitasatospora]|uniref:TIGR03619 family F420-dependent LLM class oxidoreductase n=1 Tax=Kitasatospora TaxID=2063 RepID=UPI000C6FF92E|nr:TIGR03619 family F420-dependent LLM class oxidoreductase [Kitasatospora sp. GP30]MDH6140276.1 putative F420-dependent oxidoreductase [Kitasatospora sp. GP30]